MSVAGRAAQGAPRVEAARTAPRTRWPDFETFYRSEAAAMERAMILALGDVEFGRDATAEGFARALQRWKTVGGFDNPSGWVFRVGLNWASSRRRRRRRDDVHRVAVGPSSTIDRTDGLSGEVVAALHTLSQEHRTVVVARHVLDWSEADVAEALDIPPGTVKSRASRALSRLAELLEDTDA